MARYIDADETKSVIKANDWSNPCVPVVVNMIIDHIPTADVVPRSENESLRKSMFPSYCQAITEEEAMKIGYERGKIEVAKEIFDEIEFDIHQLMFERDEHRAIAIEGVIANLKKKYTEDVNNG